MATKLIIAGLALIVFALVASFVFLYFGCEDDWCLVFNWQKIRATGTYEEGGKQEPIPPKHELIRVESPAPYTSVKSPLTVRGEARGFWFFEASFPVKLLDGNGKEIAVGIAQAQSEWMTKEFVPFIALLEFSSPKTEEGMLVLEKDNPSGLPEHADVFRFPVRFTTTSEENAQCRITGCSGQICADQDVITTCEFKPEYACFRTAQCEPQADGTCGWTDTQALRACLERAKENGNNEIVF